MKKSVLLIVSMWLLSGQIFAQRFEWAKGFAPGENVAVVGSVTDSVGNLYILGSINFNTCWENGSRLLPIVPHDNAHDYGDAMIAKISPAGDWVWHKVIHGNYTNSVPYDIKSLGDTAFACLIEMPLATWYYYLYYLDTLINPTWHYGDTSFLFPDYPMSAQDSYDYAVLALITFDFDGNVLEQHFLQMSYLDYNGDDIRYTHPAITNPLISNERFKNPSFAMDGEGNIYLSRWTYDMVSGGPVVGNYSVEDGTISAVKFWCDRRVVGVVPADSMLATSPQILKFSPHFDTLLGSRYLFQTKRFNYSQTYPFVRMDNRNGLYVIGTIESNNAGIITVDSSRNIYINKTIANNRKGYLVKFSPSLQALYCISLDDSVLESNAQHSGTFFHDIAFDYDSNIMFLCATTGRGIFGDTTSLYSILTYQGESLNNVRNDAFIMSFRIDDDSARMLSYGAVSSKMESDALPSSYREHDKITCQGNRVIIQTTNTGGFHFPNRNIEWPNWSDASQGYVVFDYKGNIIGGDCYYSFSPRNSLGSIVMKDSVLFLTNRLVSDATFGDIHVPSRGEFFACIAKYTDPAFMSTYERPRDTTVCVTVTEQEMTVVRYPNPTTGRLTIDMQGRPLREAYVAAVDGIAEPLRVTPLGGDRYAADLTGRPAGTYVLVLVTDNQHVYHCHVILQR